MESKRSGISLDGLLCGATLFLSACATQIVDRHAADTSRLTKLAGSEAIFIAPSQIIDVHVSRSNIAGQLGGGMIPALIDELILQARQSAADKTLLPVRESLSAENLGDMYRQRLEPSLRNLKWLNLDSVKVHRNVSEADLRATFQSKSGRALIVASIAASFTTTYEAVRIYGALSITNPTAGKDDEPELLYREQAEFIETVPEVGGTQDVNLRYWQQDNSVRIRTALANGVEQVSRELMVSLQSINP